MTKAQEMPRPITPRVPPAPPESTLDQRGAAQPDVSTRLTLGGEIEPALRQGFVRKPFGDLEQKLAAPSRPGYHRHWFNDDPQKPGRIDDAYSAGYTHVRDAAGKPLSRIVGRGGMKAYLMECPIEFWEQDMALQEARNRKTEAAMRGGMVNTDKPEEARKRYIPEEGISFREE